MSVLSEFLDKLTPKERSEIADHFGLETNDAQVISTHLGDELERLICPSGPFTVDEWLALSPGFVYGDVDEWLALSPELVYSDLYEHLRTDITVDIAFGDATISQALRDEDVLDRMASCFNRTSQEVVKMLRNLNDKFRGNSRLRYMAEELAPSKWPQKKSQPNKSLPKNKNFELPIFSLENLTRDELKTFADQAPQYKSAQFKKLVSNTIGAIHQIPRLFHSIDGFEYQLKHIEAYFGRSSGAASNHQCDNLYQRVCRAGFDERHHEYGMIFARTTLKDCALYEHHGIRLFEILRKTDGLCISNRSISAFGRRGTVEPGFLYITFRIIEEQEEAAQILTDRTIKELIEEDRKKRESSAEIESIKAGLECANDVNHHGDYEITPDRKIIDYLRRKIIDYPISQK
ncbi:hypothetical protein [Chromatium okenii]|jgi:hypothetical protein|uniref:hypothetical protein n=1 Tax=Chromatium okenii TaxID=61644 RepID=UPI0026F2DE01|nr:hypothetical protein [Chromatium okenii]MBV5308551.1 hypothetical protein [Chromatium okenii]